MKKTLLMAVLLVLVAFPVSAATQKATLINSQGNKVVVVLGSSAVGQYFASGYVLMVNDNSIPKPANLGSMQINLFRSSVATSTTTVAGKAAVVLLANPGRSWAMITNTSATIAYLAMNATTTVAQLGGGLADYNFAVPLAASGGTFTINLDNLYIGQLLASSSAAVTIKAVEGKF